jgi:uncharacterized protein (DUF302 family)
MSTNTKYGLSTQLSLPYDQAVDLVREALAAEGFGVLTEIDVKGTFKKKLDIDFPPYIILGACNPPLAHQALSVDADIGLLLPCNVVVYQTGDPNLTTISAIDPVVQLGVTGNSEIEPVAIEVRNRLQRVLEAVGN